MAPLELTQSVNFAPDPKSQWSYEPGPRTIRKAGFVLVDTDNDSVADTYLPGTSNFAAGRATNLAKAVVFTGGETDTLVIHAGHEVAN